MTPVLGLTMSPGVVLAAVPIRLLHLRRRHDCRTLSLRWFVVERRAEGELFFRRQLKNDTRSRLPFPFVGGRSDAAERQAAPPRSQRRQTCRAMPRQRSGRAGAGRPRTRKRRGSGSRGAEGDQTFLAFGRAGFSFFWPFDLLLTF